MACSTEQITQLTVDLQAKVPIKAANPTCQSKLQANALIEPWENLCTPSTSCIGFFGVSLVTFWGYSLRSTTLATRVLA
jgi:hypothetical protein